PWGGRLRTVVGAGCHPLEPVVADKFRNLPHCSTVRRFEQLRRSILSCSFSLVSSWIRASTCSICLSIIRFTSSHCAPGDRLNPNNCRISGKLRSRLRQCLINNNCPTAASSYSGNLRSLRHTEALKSSFS